MAIVYSDAYQAAYLDEPNNQAGGGKVHGKPHVIWGKFTASGSDECYVGKIPAGSTIMRVEDTDATATIALEDADGNSLAIGDTVTVETTIVAVPSAALADDYVFITYLQD